MKISRQSSNLNQQPKQRKEGNQEKQTTFQIKQENIFFVVVSWQTVSFESWKDLILNKKVDVVLGREDLKCLYSPSLRDLEVFFDSEEYEKFQNKDEEN